MANRKRIMVFDDDVSVLIALKRVLNAYGFDAQVFGTMESFRKGARFDEASCLILDINLDGHSGIELRKQLTAEGVLIPVIFITAVDNNATREAALQAGCVAYLHKPFPSRDLIDAIHQVS